MNIRTIGRIGLVGGPLAFVGLAALALYRARRFPSPPDNQSPPEEALHDCYQSAETRGSCATKLVALYQGRRSHTMSGDPGDDYMERLGELGVDRPDVHRVLLSGFKHSDPRSRLSATRALANLNSRTLDLPTVRETLLPTCELFSYLGPQISVRTWTDRANVQMVKACRDLFSSLARQSSDPVVRSEAGGALGRFDSLVTGALTLDLSREPHKTVAERIAMGELLGNID
jgi:hypothetical protein